MKDADFNAFARDLFIAMASTNEVHREQTPGDVAMIIAIRWAQYQETLEAMPAALRQYGPR